MGKTSSHFTNKRGQKLYFVSHTPDNGAEVKAVVFWHHGLGEYIDRFDATFKVWTDAGIAVYGFDVHGMGLSEPLDKKDRILVKKFEYLPEDAVQFLEEVLQPALKEAGLDSKPLFMAGNSLGGLVASHMVLRRPDAFAGLLMQSPAIDVEWTPVLRFQAAVGNVLAAMVPRAHLVPAVRPEDMSQDPAVVQAYLDDPLIPKGNVKAQTGNECLKGFRALVPLRKQFKLPIYAVHGTDDKCTSLPALREHLKHVSSTDVTLKEVPQGRHELLFGPEKDEVRAEMRDWILAHAK
ncbi:hypothetical protein HYH02_006428 [Chlamydomonas schloesseri]|uniref:Serine aminopeptidase S33 domain-containing protein n=1 Tax=Chlamydomonas schloesseri TaxID=2026947 RepID=A0A836B5X7_9CHLO|nr:hypothetical protein HYH02_006428 [Chlamydomonas schloesseri]|eukprot:KAG2448537.1 hypothetical protein HYH02_006428 [Chlamydomonas schloesseri]